MKNRLLFIASAIGVLLLGVSLSGCVAMMAPAGEMADSLEYVRQHKGEGTRRSLVGSEAELMDEVVKSLDSIYTITREPHALFAEATNVDLSYAYYFYPSPTSGQTEVEILIASPWFEPAARKKFENDGFSMFMGYINARLLEDGFDPNVKEGSMLPLSTAAFSANRETSLKLLRKGAKQDLAIAELNDIATRNLPYLDTPANRMSHDKAKAGVVFLNSLASEQRTAERTAEQNAELKALLAKKDMAGLRAYLDAHPETLSAIEDPHLRLRYTGPAELRIVDIAQLVKNGKKDALIIARINSTQAPYKQFTVDEMSELTAMGLSDEVVVAMIAVTTEYNKDQKRLAEQQQALARQAAPSLAPGAAQSGQPATQQAVQETPEANSAGECLKLIAALKVCEQSGGFIEMACKSLARTQFNCPRL